MQVSDDTIIAYIDSLNDEDMQFYSDHFIPINLKHYLDLQLEWILTERYFVGIKLKRNPSEEDLIASWIIHKNSERFRIFYCFKYPESVMCNY